VSNRCFAGFRWGQRGHVSSAAFSFRCGAIRCGANSLKLALHFCGTLTDTHRLAHCNERGRADVRRVDNGDNLRRRDVHRRAMWPGECDEGQNRWEPPSYLVAPRRLYTDDRWHQLLLRISNWLQEEPLEVGRSALFLA
jgi:hypothetical protein